MNLFKLTIETPEGTLLKNINAYSIKFKADDGYLKIYAHHLSLMTATTYTRVTVEYDDNKNEVFLARNGIFNFDNKTNSAKFLAEYCQPEKETSIESIKEYLDYIKSQLEKKESLNSVQLTYLENEQFAVEKLLTE